MKNLIIFIILSLSLITLSKANSTINVSMRIVTQHDHNKSVGSITLENSHFGLMIIPHLKDLPPGLHGFHVHVHPDCGQEGLSAGGHLDPTKTNQHLGPYNVNGHLGDLPVLYINKKGEDSTPIVAPKLTLAMVKGHSLMIHLYGDNYSDKPQKLGGGGPRLACGVIK